MNPFWCEALVGVSIKVLIPFFYDFRLVFFGKLLCCR